MDGWEKAKLGNLLVKVGTIDPRKKPHAAFKYVDVSSVSRQTFRIEDVTTLKGADAPSRARRHIKNGDILFATIRPTLQRIAMVPAELDGQVCSTGYFVLRAMPGISSRFLFYYLFTKGFSDEMEARQKGASYPAVNDSDVQEQIVHYPPLPEQQRIVAILDEAFAGIDAAIANTQANLTAARELFESTLNRVFTEKGEGWIERAMSEVYDIRDGTHDSPKYYGQGRALITSKNLKRDGLNFENVKYISEHDYQNICKRSSVDIGDILFAMIGTIGNPIVVEAKPDFAIKNVALFKVPAHENSYFLRYYLDSPFIKLKMKVEAKGTTQKFVGLGYLRSFPISIPCIDAQNRVVARIAEIEKETQRLEAIYQQKLDALNELKQSILAKAFRGELTNGRLAA